MKVYKKTQLKSLLSLQGTAEVLYKGVSLWSFCFMLWVCFSTFLSHTANEGPMRIPYKCLVSIYLSPEMKLRSLVISKRELQYSVSQFPHSCICEGFIFPSIGLPIFAAA
jgi:hypothetical protein